MRETSEPWGPRLWLMLAVAATIASCLELHGIRTWPMADDEVPSLVEMGLMDISAATFSVPPDQVGRLARTVPVFYKTQRFLIDHLPAGELAYRAPSVAFTLLTSIVVFLVAARWRGLWFAWALFIIVHGSQPFIYLGQLDRFYAMPMLFLTLLFASVWWPRGGLAMLPVVVVLAALAVLSHNITMVVLVLAAGASLATVVLGWTPRHVLLRSNLAALVGVALYFGYIRPLVAGWHSTGNPTPVLVSFAAHAGVATLGLAAFGLLLSLVRRREFPELIWWSLVFLGGLAVFQILPIGWNPRYFLFFMPAMWVLAAASVAFIGRALGGGLSATAWYGCVALLLAPGLVSHLIDGSRHNYREAARVVMAGATPGEPILSDDAETISYYLPKTFREGLLVRSKQTSFPASEFYLVARANAWMPLPQVPGRRMMLEAEIFKRRYDEFSHILRVYRVAPAP